MVAPDLVSASQSGLSTNIAGVLKSIRPLPTRHLLFDCPSLKPGDHWRTPNGLRRGQGLSKPRASVAIKKGLEMIELRQVTKKYGDRTVLGPVDLHFAGGKTHVILGASGCGKSTMVRLIMGLIERSTGDIRIDGQMM